MGEAANKASDEKPDRHDHSGGRVEEGPVIRDPLVRRSFMRRWMIGGRVHPEGRARTGPSDLFLRNETGNRGVGVTGIWENVDLATERLGEEAIELRSQISGLKSLPRAELSSVPEACYARGVIPLR